MNVLQQANAARCRMAAHPVSDPPDDDDVDFDDDSDDVATDELPIIADAPGEPVGLMVAAFRVAYPESVASLMGWTDDEIFERWDEASRRRWYAVAIGARIIPPFAVLPEGYPFR